MLIPGADPRFQGCGVVRDWVVPGLERTAFQRRRCSTSLTPSLTGLPPATRTGPIKPATGRRAWEVSACRAAVMLWWWQDTRRTRRSRLPYAHSPSVLVCVPMLQWLPVAPAPRLAAACMTLHMGPWRASGARGAGVPGASTQRGRLTPSLPGLLPPPLAVRTGPIKLGRPVVTGLRAWAVSACKAAGQVVVGGQVASTSNTTLCPVSCPPSRACRVPWFRHSTAITEMANDAAFKLPNINLVHVREQMLEPNSNASSKLPDGPTPPSFFLGSIAPGR